MLDEAVTYIAQDSHGAAERLLLRTLEAAASLDVSSERGRIVPEWDQPASEITSAVSSLHANPPLQATGYAGRRAVAFDRPPGMDSR